MPSQAQLSSPIEQAFYEEINETEAESGGSLKTQNPEDNKWEREWIHLSKKASKFRRTVQMILCMHGWDSPRHEQAMSLIVLKFHLVVHSDSGRFKSIRVWLTFHDHDEKDNPSPVRAQPKVVAWAPFVKTTRYNETEANVKIRRAIAGEFGVSGPEIAPVEGKASSEREKELEYKRKFFDVGKSDPMVEDGTHRLYGVDFFLKQNELQKNADMDFTVAFLVARSKADDGTQPYFKARMDTRTSAGTASDFQQGLNRFFRTIGLKGQEDADIYFDPLYPTRDKPIQTCGEEGEKLAKILEAQDIRENMSLLKSSDRLTGLCPVPGLEPVTSTSASN